jgi:hypothetical protein
LERRSKEENLLIRTRKLSTKFECMTMVQKRFARKIRMDAMRTLRDAARVFRIMVFLHSAKDLSSVLRLYGAEDPSAAD